MLNKTRLIGSWRFSRLVRFLCLAVFGTMITTPSFVHAHGMGLDEMAPPVTTSILLGLACYWLIMLWPANKKKPIPALEMNTPTTDTIRIKQKPRLHVIERRLIND